MKQVIYLDHAATTQPFPEVVRAMLPYYGEQYGNPSSSYELGEKSKEAIEEARRKVADTLSADPECIYFTSGGTESDNWALRFAVEQSKQKHPHLITSAIEHSAILNTCKALEKQGVRVSYLPVSGDGIVNLRQMELEMCEDTVLVSVMYANNEIGTIQPIQDIARLAHRRGILFHTDAVQAYGQIPLIPSQLGIDLMSASGHKFNGPKGTGFLYARNNLDLKPMIYGGGQEHRMRGGTENVPGIVGLGRAASLTAAQLNKKVKHELYLQKYLLHRLFREIPGIRLNGSPFLRLPNNVNISISGVNGGALVALLDLEGICVSTASACAGKEEGPSHVQTAIGNSPEDAYGSLRITLGMENTREEIDVTVDVLKREIKKLRSLD